MSCTNITTCFRIGTDYKDRLITPTDGLGGLSNFRYEIKNQLGGLVKTLTVGAGLEIVGDKIVIQGDALEDLPVGKYDAVFWLDINGQTRDLFSEQLEISADKCDCQNLYNLAFTIIPVDISETVTEIRLNFDDLTPEQQLALTGPKGDKPAHEWNGTSLSFENPDGSMGESVNLKGQKGDKGETGDPFTIYKSYPTIVAMESDFANVPDGSFVAISSNEEDPDNAKLFLRGTDEFTFITDLSGAQGIKGDKGDRGDVGLQGYTNLPEMTNGTTYLANSSFVSDSKVYTVQAGQTFVAGTDSLTNVTKVKKVLDLSEAIVGSVLTGTNLFNVNNAGNQQGKYVSSAVGDIGSSATYMLSYFIPAKPLTNYKTNSSFGVNYSAAYDENFNVIGTGTVNNINTPANTAYVRFHMEYAQRANFMVYEFKGSTPSFEPYKENYLLKSDFIISSDNIEDLSVTEEKVSFISKTQGTNLFNIDDQGNEPGKYIGGSNAAYFLTHLIPAKPNTEYRSNISVTAVVNVSAAYNAAGVQIGTGTADRIVTPANTAFVRFHQLLVDAPKIMVYEYKGWTEAFAPFEEKFITTLSVNEDKITTSDPLRKMKKLYTLSEAVRRWKSGEKFPVGFMGDSTTDGVATTGNVVWDETKFEQDQIDANAYPYLLEQLLKSYTGSSTMRIYNAGISGKSTTGAIKYFNKMFTTPATYADAKMVGFVFGINDRTTDIGVVRSNMYSLCLMAYRLGMQPFIVTPQPIVQGYNTDVSSVSTANTLIKICRMLKDFAKEYNLEVIDMNTAADNFLKNAAVDMTTIIADTLHFADAGHKFEAGYIFTQMISDSIEFKGADYLSVIDQRPTSTFNRNEIFTEAGTLRRYWKAENRAANVMILRAQILNSSQTRLTISVDSDVAANFYMKVDGVTLSAGASAVVEIGHHTIEVYKVNANVCKYYGLSIQ